MLNINKKIKENITIIFIFFVLFYQSIMTFLPASDGLLGYILILLSITLILLGEIKITKEVAVIVLVFVFSFLLMMYTQNKYLLTIFFNFLSFGVVGILAAISKFKTQKIVKLGAYYSIFWLLVCQLTQFEYAKSNDWGFGFVMLTNIYILIIYTLNLLEKRRIIYFLVFSLMSVYSVVVMITYSGRGSVVNLLFFLFMILITSKKKKNKILAMILFISSTLIVVNLDYILDLLSSTIIADIPFVEKTINLSGSPMDISNGRAELYQIAINQIFSNPKILFFGDGVASQTLLFNGKYVHNLILHVWLEFGLLGLLGLIFIFFIFLKKIFSKNIKNLEKNFIIAIFCLGIVLLLFSFNFWQHISFFMFVFMMISKIDISKKKIVLR